MQISSSIKGNLDTQLFLEELFLEKDIYDFGDHQKHLLKLWKNEFDLKLKENYVLNKLN